jgi:mRNA interferase MazF
MGIRPGVIVSSDHFNLGDRELVVIVPLSTSQRSSELFPMHVELTPEMSGLRVASYAMCEQIRSVSMDRVYGRRPRGEVNQLAMLAIEHRLRILLDL